MLKRRIWAKKRLHKSFWTTTAVVLVLVLLAAWVSTLAQATDAKCEAICGKANETEDAREKILDSLSRSLRQTTTPKPNSLSNARIVNGYDAPERPFMALLLLYTDGDEMSDNYITCGGSIINNKFVLTAAHCVCLPEDALGGVVPCTEDNEMKWNWKRQLKVYTGFPAASDVKDAEKRKPYKNDVKNIVIIPSWKGSTGLEEEGGADLALIELAEPLKFDDPDRQQNPICMPKEAELKVPDNKAYVAGWGRTEVDTRSKGGEKTNCITDNRGPGRNKLCRFPFTFNTLYKPSKAEEEDSYEGGGDEPIELTECEKTVFPTDHNRVCQQFLHRNKNFDWTGVDFVKIWYNRGKDHTSCYSSLGAKENGWCGICIDTAKPGEEGYCHSGMANNEADAGRSDDFDYEELQKELTVVTVDKKWGYCSPECGMGFEDAAKAKKNLKETTQTILSNEDCNILTSSHGLTNEDVQAPEKIKKTEVCAGLKHEFPKYKEFERQFLKMSANGTNVYNFIFKKDSVNYLDYPEEVKKLGYYIGYSDSCEGDSGGPLFQFVDGKAYLRGVTSRGTYGTGECGISNAPGAYTQIFPFIEWILESSKTGSC